MFFFNVEFVTHLYKSIFLGIDQSELLYFSEKFKRSDKKNKSIKKLSYKKRFLQNLT